MNQDVHLLRGMLHCELCNQGLVGLHAPRGFRIYSCGPTCPTPDLDALTAEADMLLAALIRAAVTMHPEYGTTKVVPGHRKVAAPREDRPLVDADAMDRWQRCNVNDRRQVLTTAFHRIDVTRDGELRPVWRRSEVSSGAGP